MVHGIPNISIPAVSQAMARGGRMSFPVDSSSFIYSHFEHVSGVLAPTGIQGVSISKLNLLNVLIDQLNHTKRAAPPPVQTGGGFHSLLDNYRDEIKQLKADSAAMPYIQSPSAPSGVLFNLLS